MKIFKNSEVKLHKIEKLGLFVNSLLVSFLFLSLGYAFFVEPYDPFSTLIGIVLIAIGIYYPIMVYQALNGNGIYKS
ncbi:hypothetical protein BSNK01_12070 [Bacillaceae bacterium]